MTTTPADTAAKTCPHAWQHDGIPRPRPVPDGFRKTVAAMTPIMTLPHAYQPIPFWNPLGFACAGARMAKALDTEKKTWSRGINAFCNKTGLNPAELILALRICGSSHNPFMIDAWPEPLRTVWPRLLELTEIPGTTGADLTAVCMSQSEMRNSLMAKAALGPLHDQGHTEKATFNRTKLAGSCFHGAEMPKVQIKRANADGVDFSETVLREASLQRTSMQGADLRGADLRGADLKYADLNGADLRGADLTGAELTGAVLQHALYTRDQLSAKQSRSLERRQGGRQTAAGSRRTNTVQPA